MYIAGVLIRTRPERIRALQPRLAEITGVEVHGVTDDGRFIVTVEGAGRKQVAERIFALDALDDVLTAAMVYEQSESDSMNVETSL